MTPQTSDASDPPIPQPAIKPHQQLRVEPATDAANPAVLQPGQTLEVTVEVHNTTPQPDRFWLTHAGFPKDWVSVRYVGGRPEPGTTEPQVLILAAGEKGKVGLQIQPPSNAPAIPYTTTLQLHSQHLLEPRSTWLYLQVLPIHALHLELKTVQGNVQKTAGQYEICLRNQGNTDRRIALRVQEANRKQVCDYLMTPARFWVLPPKDSGTTQLWVKPKRAWKRPIVGNRSINFWVEVEDSQQLPIPTDRLQGTLVWQGRPFWQLLLGLLAGLGSLGAIGLLATGLLNMVSDPQILEFATENPTYQESEATIVRLNWQVKNSAQLQSLKLTSQVGKSAGKSIVYDFSRGVPKELQPFCQLQQALSCKGVPTAARDVGNYGFELELVSKTAKGSPDRQKTEVSIQPQIPTIAVFKVNDKDAPAKLTLPANSQPLNFSWQVKGGRNFTVELSPTPGKVQAQGKLAYMPQPGVKQLTLKATNSAGQQVSRSVTIETAAAPPTKNAAETPNLPQFPTVVLDLPSFAPIRSPVRATESGRTPPPQPGRSPSSSPQPLTVPPSELPPQFN